MAENGAPGEGRQTGGGGALLAEPEGTANCISGSAGGSD